MTTVGYGDFYPVTEAERWYGIFLMIFGGFVFSLITGSLSSILSSVDASNAALNEKMLYLNRL